MTNNVGGADRAIRIVLGLALLGLFFLQTGNLHWIGLIGIVPLMTGILRWCPAYRLFGISTCGSTADKAA